MAPRQPLETSTETWADLFSNGKKYIVPRFQRDYSWGEDQWNDLWRDVVALGESDSSHYMGTIVLKQREDGAFEVIDGQQRLATLSILALAVIDAIQSLCDQGQDREKNEQRVRLLKDRLISAKHPASLHEESRLRLNRNDDGFFQVYLAQLKSPPNPQRLRGSEKRLWLAFEYFRRKLREDKASLITDGAALASFLTDTVAAGIQLIKITVQDDLSAYTVFETLNARGLQLTATDLLKNYLFSLVAQSSSDLDIIQDQWERLVARVSMEDFPDFVYHYLVSLGVDARKQRLFADMRNRVTKREDVFEWMNRLQDAADWYVALADPNDELWHDYPGAREHVRELVLYRVDQYKPLILAARSALKKGPQDLVRLLHMCSVVSFRATIIMHRNTADVLRAYQASVRSVREEGANTAAKIFDGLRSLYPTDDEFERAFANAAFEASGPRKKLVKYVLCVLEGTYESTVPDFESDPGTIEHILPENPSAPWTDDFTPEDRERFTSRLGNLTLLESPLNRAVGIGSMTEKVARYATSKYAMTRAIKDEEWNPASIRSRQEDLARRAVHAFRVAI